MLRRSMIVLAAALLGGCSGAPSGAATQAPPATSGVAATPAPGGGGGGATGGTGRPAILDAADAVKHMCDLLPLDLVVAIVPSPVPQEEQFPKRCTVYGEKTAMSIEMESFNTIADSAPGAKTITGVGSSAFLEELAPGNFYLSVGMSSAGGLLHVEVDNQDGKDHTDEAVNIAKAVLAKLAGG